MAKLLARVCTVAPYFSGHGTQVYAVLNVPNIGLHQALPK